MSLIESYEQQYSTVTADITHTISKVAVSNGVEKQNNVKQADKLFEEANELLEQMELEVKEQGPKERQKYNTRVKSFKIELTKLQTDLLQEMDTALGKSSRVLSGMMQRIIQNRVMLLGVGLLVLISIILSIYFMVR
ncbi:vesicle transport through interaction with t-SNAREs homolog 1A-like [Elysia marginata]|uniref:Vesicle transport through interaction with t-SNAREs homolog 1A-like n=1 Tax=Elysia marginata TaxID=1093978 RepID=A0AAV4HY80_9GAST|nr:vesicle transport through interaction with t-SNAREs homolog 1A-like [Elysia marginata]